MHKRIRKGLKRVGRKVKKKMVGYKYAKKTAKKLASKAPGGEAGARKFGAQAVGALGGQQGRIYAKKKAEQKNKQIMGNAIKRQKAANPPPKKKTTAKAAATSLASMRAARDRRMAIGRRPSPNAVGTGVNRSVTTNKTNPVKRKRPPGRGARGQLSNIIGGGWKKQPDDPVIKQRRTAKRQRGTSATIAAPSAIRRAKAPAAASPSKSRAAVRSKFGRGGGKGFRNRLATVRKNATGGGRRRRGLSRAVRALAGSR